MTMAMAAMTMTATKINVNDNKIVAAKRKREARTNMQYFEQLSNMVDGYVKRYAEITQKRGINLTKRSRIQNEITCVCVSE